MANADKEVTLFARRAFHQEICSHREFGAVIERERRRTDRTGVAFSIAILDAAKLRSDPAGMDELLSAIRRRARSTDELGWFDSESLGVLLVDTPAEGAHHFLRQLISTLPGHLPPFESFVLAYPSGMMALPVSESHAAPDSPAGTGCTDPESVGTSFCTQPTELRASAEANPAFPLESWLARGIPLWKRGLDLLIALPALILLLPLFLLVAAWIEIVSPGPVFFCQQRIGFRGKPFKIWKFRTMEVGSDQDKHRSYVRELVREEINPMKKLDDEDPQIITLGRLLRRSGLDELPQLLNVVLGQMSLVGPRPCLPCEYQEYLLWHKRRFYTLPGMTGLWQVKGKNSLSFKEMIRLDINYEQNRSFRLDLKILFATPLAVWKLVAVG